MFHHQERSDDPDQNLSVAQTALPGSHTYTEIDVEMTRLRRSSCSTVSSKSQSTRDGEEIRDEGPASENLLGTSQDKPWRDPVRWCVYANAAVLLVNIIMTVAAIKTSASHYGPVSFGSITTYRGSCDNVSYMKTGFHGLINVLSVILTATSSYCCNILIAPSRPNVDRAHSRRTCVSIGVFSLGNFENTSRVCRLLWILLIGTTFMMQLVYNSIFFSSVNANSYAALIASEDFVSNSSVPISTFDGVSCFQKDDVMWNLTGWDLPELRSNLLNGTFERLSKEDCFDKYAVNYLTDRRTIVAVPSDPAPINASLALVGYGFPTRITAAIPDNPIGAKQQLVIFDRDPSGFGWICASADDGFEMSCSNKGFQGSGTWEIFAVYDPKLTQVNVTNLGYQLTAASISSSMGDLESKANLTMKAINSFVDFFQDNPTVNQTKSYLENVAWSDSPSSWRVSSSCDSLEDLASQYLFPGEYRYGITQDIDHCLSQKTDEECELLYHLPIAVTMLVCNIIKLVCLWCLVYINRHDLILNIGDAISSFLQRPDPTTKNRCMLSHSKVHPTPVDDWWKRSNNRQGMGAVLSDTPHPEECSTKPSKIWRNASKGKIWVSTLVVMILYIAMTQILLQIPVKSRLENNIWDSKGFSQMTPETLLLNFSNSYIGMELLANSPQVCVTLLYMLLNDTLTRMLLAADYNKYAVSRRALRVSFPRGEQRSTLYLTIPYRYSVPFLLVFTLIHWFVSEGISYVQILPYDIYGHPIHSAIVMTCNVSTIPFQISMFLAIAMFFGIAFLGVREFRSQAMPAVFECSLALSAACHPPADDFEAAFKPVMWGVVESDDSEAECPHCSFSSKEVGSPKEGMMYA